MVEYIYKSYVIHKRERANYFIYYLGRLKEYTTSLKKAEKIINKLIKKQENYELHRKLNMFKGQEK